MIQIKRKKKKKNIGTIIIFFLIFLNIAFIASIYHFEKVVTPTVMAAADMEMRAKSTEIINQTIVDEYTKQFSYNDIIQMDKDDNGNIVMIKADTLKMNKIACDVALKSQDKLQKLGRIGVKVPLGYILKSNILAYYGPSITIKMEPIGFIETKYISQFESAGINQTRHRIYVQVRTDVRVILPMENNDIQVINEVPIAETIIVGKIPETSVNLGMQDASFKLKNETNDKGK